MLEEFQELEAVGGSRRAIKVIEEDPRICARAQTSSQRRCAIASLARFGIRDPALDGRRRYAQVFLKLENTFSNALQLSPQKAILAQDFNIELARLYDTHVAPPARAAGGGIVESTRAWIRNKLKDVFQRASHLRKTQTGRPYR